MKFKPVRIELNPATKTPATRVTTLEFEKALLYGS